VKVVRLDRELRQAEPETIPSGVEGFRESGTVDVPPQTRKAGTEPHGDVERMAVAVLRSRAMRDSVA
jgi:hypothetical protein